MNARQRRGALLMILALIGALAVFVSVFAYVNGVSKQVGPKSTAYTFVRDVTRNSVVAQTDLKEIEIPDRWIAAAAVRSFDASRGLVATADIRAGAVLQEGMVGPPPELAPGEREIAILIDAETGVAGKIRSGDSVDIYATFEAQQQDQQARVLVADAKVLAIGQLQQITGQARDQGAQRFSSDQVVPVTFALGVQESLKLTYAESFAVKVRLALVAPGSRSPADPNTSILRRNQLFAVPPK